MNGAEDAAKPPVTLLLLADYGGPYSGSFIAALRAIAGEVRERGWRVECVFTPIARDRPWLADLEADGIPVGFTPGWDRKQAERWLRAKLGSLDGAVVVHTHFTALDLPAVAAARGRRDTAVLWHVHSSLPRQPQRVLISVIKYGWIARRVSRIICAGEGPAAAIRGRGGPARRTVVIANGIDTGRFGPVAPAERFEARDSLGLPPDGPVLLHFSWNWQVKGGPLFAECLAELRRSGSTAIGLTVGGGDAARRAAAELGLGDALRAPEPDENVRRFYAAADALLGTSEAEGGGPTFAILEALSCGLPVIATDIPGHTVDKGTPKALRNAPVDAQRLAVLAMEVLARSPGQRDAEAAEASRWVEQNRGLAVSARETVALYEEALSDR